MQLTLPPTDITSTSTGFVNDNIHRVVEGFKSLYTNSIGDERSQSIQRILSNYRLVDKINVDANTAAQGWLVKDMINQPQFASKINGSMGIRGTFKFKLTWNTTPMTQGMYVLAYIPEWVHIPLFSGAVMADITFLTGCPHVIVNISRDTSAELVLPYVGETPYIPLYNTDHYAQQAGRIIFMPIERSVDSTGFVTFSIALYFAMDNVELMGLQPTPAAAQAALAMSAVAEAIKKSQLVSKGTASISSWFNDMEPTPLTQTAGWITGGISKIADFMGWSKPNSVKPLDPVIMIPTRDLFHGDGVFTGVRMTMNADAGISTCQMGPTEDDEMSIAHFVHRSEIFDKFTLAMNSEVGTRIYNTPTAPGDFYREDTVGTAPNQYTYTAVTHLNYLSSLFAYYRGSIRMKLFPVVTRFHSARLRVVVSMRPATQDDVRNNMSYTYTAIVDLDDPNTWEFSIPYLSQNPWRDTNSHEENISEVSIFVENKLVAPANVAQSVQIYVGVRGGEDFEVCAPQMQYTGWFYNTAPIAPSVAIAEADPTFDLAPIFGSSEDASNLANGDPVRSLRPLTRRFAVAANIGTSQQFSVVNMPLTKQPTSSFTPDFVSAVAASYVFFRGGTRIYAQNDGSADATFDPRYYVDFATKNGVTTSALDPTNQVLPIAAFESTKFELPYYAKSYQTNLWKAREDKWTRASAMSVTYRSQPYANVYVLRAAADDFSVGYLIGAPWKVKKV